MNRKTNILQFRKADRKARSVLDDLLGRIDDPQGESPGFLFENPGAREQAYFQEEEDEYLLFLEDDSLLIDGGEGVTDILVAKETTSLAGLLANGDSAISGSRPGGVGIPLVRNVEVLLTGNIGIAKKSELPALGISAGSHVLCLDARWKLLAAKPEFGAYPTEIWIWPHGGIRLETTLPVRRMPAEGEPYTASGSGESGE